MKYFLNPTPVFGGHFNCPGTAVERDWRNKTEHCSVWKELIKYYEEKLISKGVTPITKHKNIRQIEMEFINNWKLGKNASLNILLKKY